MERVDGPALALLQRDPRLSRLCDAFLGDLLSPAGASGGGGGGGGGGGTGRLGPSWPRAGTGDSAQLF